MPSPVAHALTGLTVHVLTVRGPDELRDPRRLGLVVGAAVAPDLDLLLRLFDDRHLHQGVTHSIGFSLLAALVVGLLARLRGWERPLALGLAVGAGWFSHVLLDYFGQDTHPPIGLMVFWPFDASHLKFPWPVFMDIGRTLEWATVRHNTVAVAWEVLLLAPLLLSCWRLRRRLLD